MCVVRISGTYSCLFLIKSLRCKNSKPRRSASRGEAWRRRLEAAEAPWARRVPIAASARNTGAANGEELAQAALERTGWEARRRRLEAAAQARAVLFDRRRDARRRQALRGA